VALLWGKRPLFILSKRWKDFGLTSLALFAWDLFFQFIRRGGGVEAVGDACLTVVSNDQLLTHIWSNCFSTGTVGRAFSIRVERTYPGFQTRTYEFSVNYFDL
jgi:hypothetical protein